MTGDNTPLACPYTAGFAGDFDSAVTTVGELEMFLETAAAGVTVPPGHPASAALRDPDGTVIEFLLLPTRAFLRRGRGYTTEPGFMHASGISMFDAIRAGDVTFTNALGAVEVFPANRMLCTPGWVRAMVTELASTGERPRDVCWTRPVEDQHWPSYRTAKRRGRR